MYFILIFIMQKNILRKNTRLNNFAQYHTIVE